MRLDKMICDAGWGSRSEIKQWIQSGRVKVNGIVCRSASQNVESSNKEVLLDDKDIDYNEAYWLMMNKPSGILSATTDKNAPTVISLLEDRYKRMDLFPVGRLDKDSTGFILLTNDGKTGHELLSPKNHVSKLYRVVVEGEVDGNAIKAFESGITLADGAKLQPATLEIIESGAFTTTNVKLTEGKYHQIKRMFGVLGFPVCTLHRLSIGELTLDLHIEAGKYRRLTTEEVNSLKNHVRFCAK